MQPAPPAQRGDAPPVMPCWFCGVRPAEPRAEARYELHRDVRRGYTVQSGRLGGHVWAHRWAMVGLWLGMLLGTLVGLKLVLASRSPSLGLMLLGLLALPGGMFVGARLGRVLSERRGAGHGAGRWRRGDGYPLVAAQIAQGWRPGKPFLVTK